MKKEHEQAFTIAEFSTGASDSLLNKYKTIKLSYYCKSEVFGGFGFGM